MSTQQHIYLSPHCDDAALSCGGQIAQRAAAGDTVIVATVFSGIPNPERLSPFAAAIHARPGGDDDLMTMRRAEDAQALSVLGAINRPGDYLDCIYRQDAQRTRWLYDHEEALFGPVAPAERGLPYELAQVFASLAPKPATCVLYAPLAVGNHVDHQIVHKAAWILHLAGYTVFFYEDYPYIARDPDGLELALGRGGRTAWRSHLISFDEASMTAKVEAVRAYRSQTGILFGAEADIKPALLGHTHRTAGPAAYAERLWQAVTPPLGPVDQPAAPSAVGHSVTEAPVPQRPTPWQALRARLRGQR